MFLNPNSAFVTHVGQNSGRGLSPRVWKKALDHMRSTDGGSGLYAFDDFLNIALTGGVAVSSNAAWYTSTFGQYKSYEDSTGVVGQSLTHTGGVLSMATDAGNNDENWIQCSGGVLGAINYDTGPKLTIFETRFQVSSVVDDVEAVFLGLSEEARAVADQKVDDTGVLADKDYIGFDTVHTNSGTAGTNAKLNFVYNKASGSGPITGISTVQTLVAATWYKAGFVYDPLAVPADRLIVYIDGEPNANHISATEINNSTDFPDGEELTFLAGQKAGTTTASSLLIDWWAAWQAT